MSNLEGLIAEVVAKAMAEFTKKAQRDKLDDKHSGNGGGRQRNDDDAKGKRRKVCTYKTFLSCNPTPFYGNEGATRVIHWLKEMEAVLDMSECTEENKVLYVAHSLEGYALTWWHMVLQTRGQNTVDLMRWGEFKDLMTEAFCPAYKIEKMEAELLGLEMKGKDHMEYTNRFIELNRSIELARLAPHLATPESRRIGRYIWGLDPQIRGLVRISKRVDFESVVELASTLTDDMIRSGSLEETSTMDLKRKLDDRKSVGESSKRGYKGKQPLCKKCNRQHVGQCRLQDCYKCGKMGHVSRDCTALPNCFECGEAGHLRYDCWQLKGNKPT